MLEDRGFRAHLGEAFLEPLGIDGREHSAIVSREVFPFGSTNGL